MTIFIGGAWPYANGSLHLGHVASLLPGDILARYYRLKGEEVLFVSGSDCHGTPISLRAQQENKSPASIVGKYHKEFIDSFKKLGFSYDIYIKTDNPVHHQVVQGVFLSLLEKKYIYKKEIEQIYCPECEQFLPDRYIEGVCPQCGTRARGDQCDNCSLLIDPLDLIDRSCKLCGKTPVKRRSEHFFLALSKLKGELAEYLGSSQDYWRDNAVKLSQRYLNEGLKDRAITRDLPWGIDVPLDGYESKKIYVWVEAVLGYYTASKIWADDKNYDVNKFWQDTVTSYYVHGKDNIPFHTLILPALLLGLGDLNLPDKIISSEYLTIEGRKLSTSNNWAIWVEDILKRYDPDSIRYYLTINGPEKRDSNFSWQEFIYSHNGELLGAYGNFVNRTLVFIEKYYSAIIPEGEISKDIYKQIIQLYGNTARSIEGGQFKNALKEIFDFIRQSNKYYDEEKPWITRKEDDEKCRNTIYSCVQIIANLANLLLPFLPFSSEKVKNYLGLDFNKWSIITVESGTCIPNIDILFERINPTKIKEEKELLLSLPTKT